MASAAPATTRAEVHYLILAPDPWLGPPPKTPLKNGAVTKAVTNAITEKLGVQGSEIMMCKAATPYRKLGANHFFIMMGKIELASIEVATQLIDGIEVPHEKGMVKLLIEHERDEIEEEEAPKATQANGAALWVYANSPGAVALLDEPAVKEGLNRLGLAVLEGPFCRIEKKMRAPWTTTRYKISSARLYQPCTRTPKTRPRSRRWCMTFSGHSRSP